MNKPLNSTKRCLSLTELKDIREKLKKSIVVSKKEKGASDTKFFLKENLVKSIQLQR